jgi:hypothetical protein
MLEEQSEYIQRIRPIIASTGFLRHKDVIYYKKRFQNGIVFSVYAIELFELPIAGLPLSRACPL